MSKSPEAPKVRQPHFEFTEGGDLPRYWWDNDPAKTLLLAALSATFPPGEKFFIDSVRHYQHQIKDLELLRAIKGFIGQEAHHSREHQLMNDLMQSRGIDLARFEREIQHFMDVLRERLSPERQLAHTVAAEHFTAMMADALLLQNDALDEMDPRIAALWAWHAIEETEHKAVAFDVFKAIGGSEWVRVSEMMVVSVMFPLFTTLHLIQLMKDDGQLGNLRSWFGAANYMWGKPGIFRKLIPEYLRYYSPKFHPWNQDSRKQVEKAKKRWLGDWA
ncbi:Predicted metal-dependent hydrolase [gamma proteobacterium HdN1]|nr:Predicted metal-dependent hydrolase [gamma proteobacterium HdN1]